MQPCGVSRTSAVTICCCRKKPLFLSCLLVHGTALFICMIGKAKSGLKKSFGVFVIKKRAISSHPAIALFALAMGGFAIGTTEFGTMGLVPYFSAALKISPDQAGHVISIYALGVVVGAPVLAVALARREKRSALIGLMICFALGNLLSAFAPNYDWLLFFRFISGMPHGAYFGIAALVASGLVTPERRTQAIASVMLGLAASTIFGVPLANIIGQLLSWRGGFVLVSGLALLCAALVWLLVEPIVEDHKSKNPLDELGALVRVQVWLTLGIGGVGFGGIFAVYTYLDSTFLSVTHGALALQPVLLGLFGIGLTLGSLVTAWLADKAQMPAIALTLLWSVIMLGLYPFMTGHVWSMMLIALFIGGGGGIGSALQARLMSVAGKAQTLAAALLHSAMNAANALGPFLAGWVIARGYGYSSSGWVGCVLAVGGLAVLGLTVVYTHYTKPKRL